jgi:hypothetical protein
MPATTGGSHAVSAFATLVVGAMLSKYLWEYAPPLGEASLATLRLVRSLTGAAVPLDEQFAGTLALMVSLSFLWGVFYHVGRHG